LKKISNQGEYGSMHKKIGIIGGLSPESTVSYYLHLTRSYVARFGDYGYPEILIYSVNLKAFHQLRAENRWDAIAEELCRAARALKAAGADFALIATNTMHKVFAEVSRAAPLPLLSIIEATARRARTLGLARLGLLGTSYTMDDGFYHQAMAGFGITIESPPHADQAELHRIIVEELVRGQLEESSRHTYQKAIASLQQAGAQGIILGCTEIPLLVSPADAALPLLDTARIHAEAALEMAIES
jgi:aspartate racemase